MPSRVGFPREDGDIREESSTICLNTQELLSLIRTLETRQAIKFSKVHVCLRMQPLSTSPFSLGKPPCSVLYVPNDCITGKGYKLEEFRHCKLKALAMISKDKSRVQNLFILDVSL